MKHETISLRRRQLMIAGIGGAPAALIATQGWTAAMTMPEAAPRGEEQLLVSGRVAEASGRPLAGATVEMMHPHFAGRVASALTDGDGRFMLDVTAAGGVPQAAYYRVIYRGQEVSGDLARFDAGWRRDEGDVLRNAFAVTVA